MNSKIKAYALLESKRVSRGTFLKDFMRAVNGDISELGETIVYCTALDEPVGDGYFFAGSKSDYRDMFKISNKTLRTAAIIKGLNNYFSDHPTSDISFNSLSNLISGANNKGYAGDAFAAGIKVAQRAPFELDDEEEINRLWELLRLVDTKIRGTTKLSDFERLLNGDLKHIGDALINGKNVLLKGVNRGHEDSLDFSLPSEQYSVAPSSFPLKDKISLSELNNFFAVVAASKPSSNALQCLNFGRIKGIYNSATVTSKQLNIIMTAIDNQLPFNVSNALIMKLLKS